MNRIRKLAQRVWNAVPMTWQFSPAGRLLGTCHDLWAKLRYELAFGWALFARTARVFLLSAGLPLKRQFLILPCRKGSQAIGLFSEFVTVLGALDHYERWVGQYAGLRVDYTGQGLYYDAGFGSNWWEYYFTPISVGSADRATTCVLNSVRCDLLSYRGVRLSRKRASEIIRRYIHPKPHLRNQVESYVREHFRDAFVVGIHYRGTDKHQDVPSVPYERVSEAIFDAINSVKPDRFKLFLATDEQAFLEFMIARFPNVLTYRRMFRSIDGAPTHWRSASNHDKGEDAILDCLLLSQCQFLVRTASNLNLCSIFFNPNVPEIALSREE